MSGEQPGHREAVERIADRIVTHERENRGASNRQPMSREDARRRAAQAVIKRERRGSR